MTSEANAEDLRELYRELILDHARNPRHHGPLAEATHNARGVNPLCGDSLDLYLEVDAGQTILRASFEGTGCAISLASASLLTEAVGGLAVSAARQRADDLINSLSAPDPARAEPSLGSLRALKGVRDFPARVKCATLAWRTLTAALDQLPDGQTISTE